MFGFRFFVFLLYSISFGASLCDLDLNPDHLDHLDQPLYFQDFSGQGAGRVVRASRLLPVDGLSEPFLEGVPAVRQGWQDVNTKPSVPFTRAGAPTRPW